MADRTCERAAKTSELRLFSIGQPERVADRINEVANRALGCLAEGLHVARAGSTRGAPKATERPRGLGADATDRITTPRRGRSPAWQHNARSSYG